VRLDVADEEAATVEEGERRIGPRLRRGIAPDRDCGAVLEAGHRQVDHVGHGRALDVGEEFREQVAGPLGAVPVHGQDVEFLHLCQDFLDLRVGLVGSSGSHTGPTVLAHT
jgi:hypothetical protein